MGLRFAQRRLSTALAKKGQEVAKHKSSIINNLIHLCGQDFIDHEQEMLAGQFSGSLLDRVKEKGKVGEPLERVARLSEDQFYDHPQAISVELSSIEIVEGLLEAATRAIFLAEQTRWSDKIKRLFFGQKDPQGEDYDKMLTICSRVAEMTDSYALRLYRQIKGMEILSKL